MALRVRCKYCHASYERVPGLAGACPSCIEEHHRLKDTTPECVAGCGVEVVDHGNMCVECTTY